MGDNMDLPIICPVCRAPLTWGERRVTCPADHTFDIAREGYVNLYRTSRRRSNQPGDTRDMLLARRAFLDAGWYAPLSDRLNACVQDFTQVEAPASDTWQVADIGCGEGYYLGRLMQALRASSKEDRYSGCGMDIARDGVRYAARRYPEARWCVANVAQDILFADGSVDVALSIFAPRFSAVIHRIMARHGLLLIVVPGPVHLTALRDQAMADVRDTGHKVQQELDKLLPHFNLVDQSSLTYPMTLKQPDLQHLYLMTPLYWRSTREARESIKNTPTMDLTTDFIILTLTPKINT